MIHFDSRKVGEGDLFIAQRGVNADGHEYITKAVAAGAVAVVCEEVPGELKEGVVYVKTGNSSEALGVMSSNFYGNPSRRMKVVGVTGTNGKTTTATLLYELVRLLGRKAGLLSTVCNYIGDERVHATHTTPDAMEINELMSRMVEVGCEYCFMEVSSHALDLRRTWDTDVAVTAFTNLTQDHLDYHHTFDDYFEAKALLFSKDYPARRVISIDGSWGRELLRRCTAAGDEVITTGFDVSAQIHPVEVTYEAARTKAVLEVRGTRIAVEYPLVGRFNVENVMTAFGCALALGIPDQIIAEALATMPAVPGRLERVRPAVDAPVSVYVDYAHTPDALTKAIASIKELSGGRTIVVFGCGGNRDATKRPIMGAAALAADYAVVTSDNPRHEEPDAIIADIVAGMEDAERFTVEPDRRSAIAAAIALARPGDAILVAGKGHEDYQLVGDEVLSFDDRVVAAEELERAFGGACSD